MVQTAKEIVIAMLENGYIEKFANTDENIKNINKAIDEITKQLVKSHDTQRDYEK